MKFLKLWDRFGIFPFTVFVFIICWILLGPNFVTSFNILNVLLQICLIAIASIGMTFAITCGVIDSLSSQFCGHITFLQWA
jgi:ribose transport system permease protein